MPRPSWAKKKVAQEPPKVWEWPQLVEEEDPPTKTMLECLQLKEEDPPTKKMLVQLKEEVPLPTQREWLHLTANVSEEESMEERDCLQLVAQVKEEPPMEGEWLQLVKDEIEEKQEL